MLLFLLLSFLITRQKEDMLFREEAAEHEGRAKVARQHAAAQEAFAATSQYDPSYTYGYQPGYHWH